MNKCPKCDRQMVALFQIPKCEICELGGVDEPYYWAVNSPSVMSNQKGWIYASIFKNKADAEKWRSHLADTRTHQFVVVKARQSSSCTTKLEWEVLKGHEVVPNAEHLSAYLYNDEATDANDSRARFRFVVVP